MDKMIDIHNHLIPEFDDGSKSFAESLEMLKQAQEQGITDVFATSHFNEYIPAELEEEYFIKLQKLREEALANDIRVNIHSGSEIFYHHYVESTVKKSRVTTLGGMGQYVLIEFPLFQMPAGVEDVLFRLSVENYIPIVAHPERYTAVLQNISKATGYIQFGGLLQLNGGSILGHFGKEVQEVSLSLLEKGFVHFIASDAHSSRGRTFVLRNVYESLKDRFPEDYLTELLYSNPRRIIDNISIEKAQIPEGEKESGFFKKMKKWFR